MTAKKVSIIVPVFNTQKYLERCINSLIGQTLKELEIIIVDDGSETECSKLCDYWAERDPRIRVIHKKNEGLGYARNTGIEAASGEYLAFIDSDDYIRREMFEKLYNRAVKTKADIVIGGYIKKFDNGSEQYFCNDNIQEVLEDNEIKEILLPNMLGTLPENRYDDGIGMSVWKNLYARSIFDNYNIRFPSEREYISEDIIFHINYLKYVRHAEIIHDAFYYYCQNEGSLSKSYRKDRFDKVVQLYLYEKELLEDMSAYNYGKLQLERTFIANVRTCIMIEAAQRKKGKSVHKVKAQIKKYCSDRNISAVLHEYPWSKLPIKQAVFSFAMVFRLTNIILLMAILQNMYRGRQSL